MTRVTLSVLPHRHSLPTCVSSRMRSTILYNFRLPPEAVNKAFYVDDGVTGADSAITHQHELHSLFSLAGFLLRKWNSSESTVLDQIDSELRDSQCICQITEPEAWNAMHL